ncbi:50S ribosomal protein L17 [Candidatus Parcubacteria bacterium]|uniref:50S ribosomal protein L17 n=1 Tax=Candidatus Kaiserbacteria bacterium CG10_big_fil_rev_8_21_14_0_10_47_16 TaxID=1974608 RepID=A0A2H0UEF1_9BACT|nr:50S ribosomal protein L17 [Candidatus Parcubacteria bacterium]PIR84767.1 MAG: 50S ribosomal protein L17 [Candidatus Kaiserbacteria bacterium CG10_big_fil_rev_8_21_14_0_10_47_16]
MQHHVKNRTLGRTRRGRTALIRGLAISLIEKGKIQTTEARAKELRPFIEKLITTGKKATVAARRQAASVLGEPQDAIIKKLFDEIGPSYKERAGGYTRIIKLGLTSAGRTEAVIELV